MIKSALNIFTNYRRINILTILKFQSISVIYLFCFLSVLWFVSTFFCSFSIRYCTYLVFSPNVFYIFCAFLNDTIFYFNFQMFFDSEVSCVDSWRPPLNIIPLLSLIFDAIDASHFSCPKFRFMLLHFGMSTMACFTSALRLMVRRLSPRRRLGNCGSHMFSFPTLRDHILMLSVVQCWKYCLIYFIQSYRYLWLEN